MANLTHNVRLNIYLALELRQWVRMQALLAGVSASQYVAQLLQLHQAVRTSETNVISATVVSRRTRPPLTISEG